MKFVFRLLKTLMGLIGLLITLTGIFSALYVYLCKKGIIRSEWIIEKTPSGKGIRFVMSVWDKLFFSFQL